MGHRLFCPRYTAKCHNFQNLCRNNRYIWSRNKTVLCRHSWSATLSAKTYIVFIMEEFNTKIDECHLNTWHLKKDCTTTKPITYYTTKSGEKNIFLYLLQTVAWTKTICSQSLVQIQIWTPRKYDINKSLHAAEFKE